MDQPTSIFLTAVVTGITTAVPATIALFVNAKKTDGVRYVVDETAKRGKVARLTQEQMASIIADTHAQVTTLNGRTIGELADATETRRVGDIPTVERSPSEAQHIATIPLPPEGKD